MEVSSTSKTDSQRTEHFQLATDKSQSPTETLKWYKKKKHFFFYSTKIGTVFFNQCRCVLQTGSQTYEQKTLRDKTDRGRDRKTDRDIEIEMLQSLLIQRAGALMAKCEIQVTIHTGTIICDALCWCLMSHSGYVGLLFCSHSKGI